MKTRSIRRLIGSPATTVRITVLLVACLATLCGSAGAATELVSLTDTGQQANDHSVAALYGRSATVDARVIAFTSFADNLVPNDDNDVSDVFVRDLTTGVTELISKSMSGAAGHGRSYQPAISVDGRWVAFASLADDLVPGDTNGVVDVFLHDRATATTRRISTTNAGDQVYSYSSFPDIAASEDGNTIFVSFTSAGNIIPGLSNGIPQIYHYTYDVLAGTSTVAMASRIGTDVGDEASVLSAISQNGKYVVFNTYCWNLIPPSDEKPTPPEFQMLYYDHTVGQVILRLITTPDEGTFPAISGNGRFFAYEQNNQVILYDMLRRASETVSIGYGGATGDGESGNPSISDDGRFVAFQSTSTNLVPNDNNGVQDVFIRDRATTHTHRVSLTYDGKEGDGSSRAPNISPTGNWIVFSSSATNLVDGDANEREDVFINNWRQAPQGGCQPDLLIKKPQDTWYDGNDTFNSTAQDQTIQQTPGWNEEAVFHIKLQNEGVVTDTFRVSGGPGGSGWLVSYYDTLTNGSEITDQVTGDGWLTEQLPPGASTTLRLVIQTDPGVSTDATWEVLVRAVSAGDATKLDVVKAVVSPPQPLTMTKDLSPGTWLVGIPIAPTQTMADQVFDTSAVAAWNSATQDYTYFSSEPFQIRLGHGYWVNYPANHSISVDGFISQPPARVNLGCGWNLLANPTTVEMPWSEITANCPIEPFGWTQSTDGSGYDLITSLDLTNANSDLTPWQGFWFYASRQGQATIGTTSATQTSNESPTPIDWALQITATAANTCDSHNYIGMVTTEKPVTGTNPPQVTNAHIDLYTLAEDGRRNAVSLIPETHDPSWTIVVETDLPNTPVSVSYPDLSSVPAQYALSLTDLQTDETINMRTTSAYTFVSGADGADRHLKVTAAPRQNRLLLTTASVHTQDQLVHVLYSISAPATVEMEILNIAGRRIATIDNGYRTKGTHTASWRRTTAHGTTAPPGRYLVSIRCAADDGTRIKRVLPAQIK